MYPAFAPDAPRALTVSQLWIYPVKGAQGIALSSAGLADRGFIDDRRWMVVDRAGLFVSQRTQPRLATLRVQLDADSLSLAAPTMLALRLARLAHQPQPRPVRIWEATLPAYSMGGAAATWLRTFLGGDFELVYMPDTSHRQVDSVWVPGGALVSFADGYPFLLTHEASLADLNKSLPTQVSMERFRANIVVSGGAAWAEDTWRTLRIGPATFRLVKPCSRCVVVNIDQSTGEGTREPLRALGRNRRVGREVLFGQNLVHSGTGMLRVGETVHVDFA